jgi:hypothetical protein
MAEGPWTKIGVIAAVLGVAVAIYIPLASTNHWFPFPAPKPPTSGPQLSLTSATVLSCAEVSTCDGPWVQGVRLGPETVDLLFSNTGNKNTAIFGAKTVVQRVLRLPTPSLILFAGHIPISYIYTIPLPLHPAADQAVPANLDENVPGNGTDRPDLAYTLGSAGGAYIYLYRLRIYFMNAPGAGVQPLEVFISLPKDPSLPKCASADQSELCQFLALPGSRSPALTAISPP